MSKNKVKLELFYVVLLGIVFGVGGNIFIYFRIDRYFGGLESGVTVRPLGFSILLHLFMYALICVQIAIACICVFFKWKMPLAWVFSVLLIIIGLLPFIWVPWLVEMLSNAKAINWGG